MPVSMVSYLSYILKVTCLEDFAFYLSFCLLLLLKARHISTKTLATSVLLIQKWVLVAVGSHYLIGNIFKRVVNQDGV